MKRIFINASFLVAVLAAALSAQPDRAQAEMTVTGIGSLGGVWSYSLSMNNKGQVVGGSLTASGEWHAFIWQDGVISDLGALDGGDFYQAVLINDRGQVVGQSDSAADDTLHLVLWEDGTIQDLGVFDGSDTYPTGINEKGQITGHSDNASFLWQDDSFTNLGGLGGRTTANGINDKGQVVGTAVDNNGQYHAFIWQDGVMTTLEGLSSAQAINESGQVICYSGCTWQDGSVTYLDKFGWAAIFLTSINERGQIAGSLFTPTDFEHTFIWEDGVTTDLGALDGIASIAHDINNFGQLVGSSSAASSPDWVHDKHPYIWLDGEMLELPRLLVNADGVGGASDVNDLGQVIGSSNDHAAFWNTREIVGIAIIPEDGLKKVKTKKAGLIDVAVLGSEGFDATLVDPSTVSLSGAEVGYDDDAGWLYFDEDVNDDGYLDRVFQVDAGMLLLTKNDTVAALQGKTYEGDPISGWGYVNIRAN